MKEKDASYFVRKTRKMCVNRQRAAYSQALSFSVCVLSGFSHIVLSAREILTPQGSYHKTNSTYLHVSLFDNVLTSQTLNFSLSLVRECNGEARELRWRVESYSSAGLIFRKTVLTKLADAHCRHSSGYRLASPFSSPLLEQAFESMCTDGFSSTMHVCTWPLSYSSAWL